jgi:hypothetical protein
MTDLAELMEEQRAEIDKLRRELVDVTRDRDRLRAAVQTVIKNVDWPPYSMYTTEVEAIEAAALSLPTADEKERTNHGCGAEKRAEV